MCGTYRRKKRKPAKVSSTTAIRPRSRDGAAPIHKDFACRQSFGSIGAGLACLPCNRFIPSPACKEYNRSFHGNLPHRDCSERSLTAGAPTPFSLVKWYMDCVTELGDAVILYCADLRWRAIHAAYSSVLSVIGQTVESHSSMARYQLESKNDQILVELPRLKISGKWEASAAPFQHTVYKDASGSVLWNCLQPRASVHFRFGDRELTGLGYAECLTVTLPPWRLPMRQLRWGRFVSPEDSLAWIDWQGPYSTSFAVHKENRCDTLSVSDSEVAMNGVTLNMEEEFPLSAADGWVPQSCPVRPRLARCFLILCST